MKTMLAIIFGGKKSVKQMEKSASMDEKRREIYINSDYLHRY
jgi:hypothetical protein